MLGRFGHAVFNAIVSHEDIEGALEAVGGRSRSNNADLLHHNSRFRDIGRLFRQSLRPLLTPDGHVTCPSFFVNSWYSDCIFPIVSREARSQDWTGVLESSILREKKYKTVQLHLQGLQPAYFLELR